MYRACNKSRTYSNKIAAFKEFRKATEWKVKAKLKWQKERANALVLRAQGPYVDGDDDDDDSGGGGDGGDDDDDDDDDDDESHKSMDLVATWLQITSI